MTNRIDIVPKSVYVAYTDKTQETYEDVTGYHFEETALTLEINGSDGIRVIPLSSIKFVEIEF